jgi:hypothetical protein
VANHLYDPDYLDRTQDIDRSAAEQLSRDALQTELPSEETLLAMFDEGQENNWRLGPPR